MDLPCGAVARAVHGDGPSVSGHAGRFTWRHPVPPSPDPPPQTRAAAAPAPGQTAPLPLPHQRPLQAGLGPQLLQAVPQRREVQQAPEEQQRVHQTVGQREGGDDGDAGRVALLLAVSGGQQHPQVVPAEGTVGQEEPGGHHRAVHGGAAEPAALPAAGLCSWMDVKHQ